jgi:hypothetical protein
LNVNECVQLAEIAAAELPARSVTITNAPSRV